MRPSPTLVLVFLLVGILNACSPAPAALAPSQSGFYYLATSTQPVLVISTSPESEPRKQIPLNPPLDCSLYALRPAPVGPWVAVEWECSFGPAVELLDTSSGNSHFPLSDPSIDSRFLAWQPDGSSLYLKIGTLSVPQTIRVDAATVKASELPVSPFAYDLTVSPDGRHVLYSLSKGIGFGSETWLAGPDGQNPSQVLVDANNIIAQAQYSPDGSQIAFIKFADSQESFPTGELWVMDSNGFHPRKLADADAGHGFTPVWSPDGARLAFVGRDQPGNPDSLNMSIYQLAQARLTSLSIPPAVQPAWATDGTSLIFSSTATQANGDAPDVPRGGTPIKTGGGKMNLWFYEISSGQAKILVSGACCAGWLR
ncbi:MAG TPA: hypothetical protein VGK00_02585 [Anaerolineales bacterium]|jgi:Tol biopolymer transport system component